MDFTMLNACWPGLLAATAIMLAAVANAESDGPAAPVRSSQSDQALTLDNGLISLRFDRTSGAFSAAASGVTFLREGRLNGAEGSAALADVRSPLGDGKAVEVTDPGGGSARVALYPGVPFLCVQGRLGNTGTAVKVIDKVTPASYAVEPGKAPAELRVLGCDGLTAGDRARTSYTFLAAADPATRAGVVAGWLTNDRASGIVLSRQDGSRLRIEGRSEYGKLRIAPGATAEGETFALGYFGDSLLGLEAFADAIARVYRVQLPPIPSGYCTWYSRPHGGAADEKHLEELARFAHENLARFGFQVVQIDDKWQISGRDYTTHNPKGPYPNGMRPSAEKIRSLGMTPGLWFIPFGWDPKRPVFQEHQDWFVRRSDGSLYEVKWAGTCLDMTHPGARELLHSTVSRMTREWGYRYLKIDGLWTGMATDILYPQPTYRNDRLGDAVFHNPDKTNIEAYRDGLKLVREAAGDGVYLLGCNIAQNMRTLGASIGLVDGLRVGRDINASWDRILPSMQMGTRLYFFHNRVWHNDPDCLMLREPLTLDQARAWGSWIALSGQLNLVSEWLPGLPADRLEVVKRSMPNTGRCGRPVDLFETADARIWHLTAGEGDARRDVIGLFNWDPASTKPAGIALARLDLPGGSKGSYAGFDYWADRFIPPFSGRLEAELPPASCRVVAVSPALDRPQVISTSRHITQGIIDLTEERWDAEKRELSGASQVVAGDPYELRIVTPTGNQSWKAASAEISPEDRQADVRISVRDAGPNVRVRIEAPANRQVRWQVRF
jgi:melibiase-like protein